MHKNILQNKKDNLKKGKKSHIWRHGDKAYMYCVKCFDHTHGTMVREGPFWTFKCPCGFASRKGLVRDKDELQAEGLVTTNIGMDPRAKGRRLAAQMEHHKKMDRVKHKILVRELGQAKLYR